MRTALPPLSGDTNRFLGMVSRRLRESRPVAPVHGFGWFIERTIYQGRPYKLPLAWFVTRGCSADRAGTCTMCNFGSGGTVTEVELIAQVGELLGRIGPQPMIYITPLGSMFDDTEVPPRARDAILQRIAATGCWVFGTESRPETISEEKIARFREIFGPAVELQVGLGLESSNRFIRRNVINKSLAPDQFEKAVGVLKRYDVKAMVHILLKPPFLTEAEAVRDAVASSQWAWEHGADRIIFLMTNRKPHTLVSWLAERGRYRVPYLWSGVEVLTKIGAGPERPVTLSGVYAGTPIMERARNCDRCSDSYLERIQEFSMTLDQSILQELQQFDCGCREEWETAMNVTVLPLRERLAEEYSVIGRGLFGEVWWEENAEWVLADLAT